MADHKSDSAGDGLSGKPGLIKGGPDSDGSTIATPAGKHWAAYQRIGEA